MLLLKKFVDINGVCEKLQHPSVFNNAPEHSIYVLLQILLSEGFPVEFSDLDVSFCHYQSDGKNISVIESISCDLSIIKETEAFNNYLHNTLISELRAYFNLINESKNCATSNSLTNIELTAERYSFKPEFLSFIQKSIPTLDIANFAPAMNTPAATCLRVNTSKADRGNVIQSLNDNGIECYYGEISPACIVLPKRHQLTTLDMYRQGWFGIQDEASQLVGYAASPQSNDIVLDACAGAGGKALHIADLQCDSGTIICNDIVQRKLLEIGKRATLAGMHSIATSKKMPIANIVLVDAPCSGSGTLRRDPMKKYTITEKTIQKIASKQYDILCEYSKYVSDGGHLIYSTCSILPQENELIVQRFLNEHKEFAAEPLLPYFVRYGVHLDLGSNDFYITLYPHIHKTDGFFIARMQKIQ
jgi:16S rRNA (cytosine(967)-C(5))-methyltransferase